jgi:hypothetical protein
MSEQAKQILKTVGVTPWQLLLGVACIGSWWATVQPLPGALERLNETVQKLSTKVEIHQVLLNEVQGMKMELRQVSGQVATISGKLAHVPGYPSNKARQHEEP